MTDFAQGGVIPNDPNDDSIRIRSSHGYCYFPSSMSVKDADILKTINEGNPFADSVRILEDFGDDVIKGE